MATNLDFETVTGRAVDLPRRAIAASCAIALLQAAVVHAAGVDGKSGAVAAEHRLASEAGVEILRRGGNAVDAAVAALLASGVVNPSSSGLGGGGFMVVYLARNASFHAIDFRETAPGDAVRDMFVRDGRIDDAASKSGGLAVAVPAEPRGFAYALARYGSMSFAQVAAPAIRLARDGFEVEAHTADALARFHVELAADPVLAAELLRPDGSPYRGGEQMRRPALQTTLERLSRDGIESFYAGPLANDIVAAVTEGGGILTKADLAGYRVVERQPLLARYRGLDVVGMPPPSSGGGVIATALAILEPYRLRDLGNGSSTYEHLLAETLKAVFADRARAYGDPDFTRVPLARLISPVRAATTRARFSAVRSLPAATYGAMGPLSPDAGTAHVSAIDSAGNAVACTSSINTAFGAKFGVHGFPLNNTMDDFSLQPGTPNAYGLVGNEANSIAPRKRPLSSMSPTIVRDARGVRLVAGASGGPLIISATLQTVLDVVDFDLGVSEAVAAARIHHQWLPDVLVVEDRLSSTTRLSLERRGHTLRTAPALAAVQAVERVHGRGETRVYAASDERKGGMAAAY
jgi:gamma-glutamyltranspeptidase/glutathione hydrolase